MIGAPVLQLSRDEFGDVPRLVAEGRPALVRGLVQDWPAVVAAQQGSEAFTAYCRDFETGARASCVVGPPEIGGRFFYRDDFRAFNFERREASVTEVLAQLGKQAGREAPLAIALQSTPLDEALPGFADANPMPLLPAAVRPRLWLGNAVRVATHYDANDNIACVVAGRRRFTLFPPEQIANLYPGPLEITPAGAPVSMVDVDAPDLDRFPRFADAAAVAQSAELAPGDAIFIPFFWWHAVRSLDPLSVLVNYWWDGEGGDGAPLDALLHALLAMNGVSPRRRALWRGLFDHFAFGSEPAAHLPDAVRGVLGALDTARRRELARHLAGTLTARY